MYRNSCSCFQIRLLLMHSRSVAQYGHRYVEPLLNRLAPPHLGIAPSLTSSDTGIYFTDMDDPKVNPAILPPTIKEAQAEASPASAGPTKVSLYTSNYLKVRFTDSRYSRNQV